ncbi:MAG: arginine--tRNA ligase [Defluviitaleaceae bacterium]|nr:arginine--tRNA ligase [Defluviitaleaceae bacterium]
MEYKQALAIQLSPHLADIPHVDIINSIEQPPNSQMGHFAYPCFRLAKAMRKAPPAIAAELAASIMEKPLPAWLQSVESAGGYVNFYLDKPSFASRVLENVHNQNQNYGRSGIGDGKVVLIDYSSPNIAKQFHVGHLGTTVIGRALYNIFNYQGYETIGINYLGDWGTSFGKLLTAYLKWGNKEEIEETGIEALTRIYVRFHEEADKDPSLEEEARNWVVKMENGNEEGLAIWRWLCSISMREYQKIYDRLGINFESYRGESYYNDKMEAAVEEIRKSGLLIESNGAQVVDLEEHKMPPCLILRRDGGTLYATRDITAAMDRYATYRFDKSLYVTANEQKLHFAQFFKVLELMEYPWAKNMEHVPYGLFIFDSGKMSTRKGQVIKLKDLLDESVAKTLDIIREKSPNLENKEEVAEQVGIGAVIFNQLYNSRIKDVVFSWERMLNFEGETGPYVQYTHARTCSIMEKAGYDPSSTQTQLSQATDWEVLANDESFEVLRLLYNFPDRIAESADKYEPFILSRFLIALAQAFNKFYNAHKVLTGDENQAKRLVLVSAVSIVLENGLKLLGISAPKKM